MSATARQSVVVNNQQCTVTGLYRVWLAYAAGLIAFAATGSWITLGVWAAGIPVGKWLQIHFYPHLSHLFGYGKVEDRTPASVNRVSTTVTFYHALGCPFCPIVLSRLKALEREMGFTLRSVDVTLHPQFLASRGIRSVPVVEVGERCLVGNPTSNQLAELISTKERAEAAR